MPLYSTRYFIGRGPGNRAKPRTERLSVLSATSLGRTTGNMLAVTARFIPLIRRPPNKTLLQLAKELPKNQ